MHTKDILAAALEEASLPEMAAKAREGYYHDFLSPLDTPCIQLAEDLAKVGTQAALALRARHLLDGEFDATQEETDAWAASPDGQEAFNQLLASTPVHDAIDEQWKEFRARVLPEGLSAIEVGVARRVFYGGALVMFNLFNGEARRYGGLRVEFIEKLTAEFAAQTAEFMGEDHQGGMQ